MEVENGAVLETKTPDVDAGVATNVEADGVKVEGNTPASTPAESPKWMSQLPDELKGNETLSKHASLGEALKALLDGSDEKAKEPVEGQKEETPPVEYNFSKDFPEEIDPEGLIRDTMKQAVTDLKLSAEDADKVYSSIVETFEKTEESLVKNASEKCEKVLKETWGDKYDDNLASMKRAYKHLVPEGSDLEKGLKASMAENNPFVADLLSKVGKAISEHDPPRSKAVGQVEQRQSGFLVRENEKYPW